LIPTAACLQGKSLLRVDEKPTEQAASTWNGAEYFLDQDDRRRGDFYYASSGNFACGRRVLDAVRATLERDCEFLPITIQGVTDDEYFLVHPLTVIQALPPRPVPYSAIEAISTLRAPQYRRAVFDRCMIFREQRFPSASVCVAGLDPQQQDFFAVYSARKYCGLAMKKVWEAP